MRRITVDLDQIGLDERGRRIAERILVKGVLRASKPPIDKGDPDTGIAAYVWRMVVFTVSDNPRHQCMPVMADLDLPGRYGSPEHKAAQAYADALEDSICNAIPREEWAGVRRWGMAFGVIGSPQVAADGSYVYR